MKAAFTKRGRLEIINEILMVCRKPAKKTSILYRCNLSYNQLQRYLKYLISQSLLSTIESTETIFYQMTDRGKVFLEEYRRLNDFLEGERNGSAFPPSNRGETI